MISQRKARELFLDSLRIGRKLGFKDSRLRKIRREVRVRIKDMNDIGRTYFEKERVVVAVRRHIPEEYIEDFRDLPKGTFRQVHDAFYQVAFDHETMGHAYRRIEYEDELMRYLVRHPKLTRLSKAEDERLFRKEEAYAWGITRKTCRYRKNEAEGEISRTIWEMCLDMANKHSRRYNTP